MVNWKVVPETPAVKVVLVTLVISAGWFTVRVKFWLEEPVVLVAVMVRA